MRSSGSCGVLGRPDCRAPVRSGISARQGHDHAGVARVGLLVGAKSGNDALEEVAGLLLALQFMERQERLPACRLIHPAPPTFTAMALRHLGIDRPGQATGMAIIVD